MHKLNFFFLTGKSKLTSWGKKKKRIVYAGFQHLSLLSQENVLWSSCGVSAQLCVVIASRAAIYNKLAANRAEKAHSRVGKYMRTPRGRTHPKHGSRPAALRVSGVQSLQLQVSHNHSANSMKSFRCSSKRQIYRRERICYQHFARSPLQGYENSALKTIELALFKITGMSVGGGVQVYSLLFYKVSPYY